ncbi:MAG: type ISP restriction/modification enzyme [Limnoraphis robusta]|uniref:site-specific DNA-methyltransferase (adenine-specific) n=1 Tax=Limnoraphis robusta CS-951 TaxID=1637645 RepID=A0A0J9EUZ7_9CYAN|nr:type ISP restriction/modification enzyme [Limnoraphis robusta]KMW69896.1 DNA methyltransferase [Limnoraphis robusta CS-951]
MSLYIQYIREIEAALQSGNATEHTHRPALKNLIESFRSGIVATNEPKRINCGAPDFVISQGQLIKGYIEAKDVGISLDKTQTTPQLKRYFNALGNLILTDYLEFRWYVRGELRLKTQIAKVSKNNRKLEQNNEGIEQLDQLLTQFLEVSTPQLNTPKELAQRMANLAQLIRDAIATALSDQDKGGMLREQLESFKKVLIKDLNQNQFADMYAQTICYGLFAARCNTDSPENFSRENAAFKLPKTNPFLRSIFSQVAGPDLDDRIVWAVDDLVTILRQTDMAEILKNFGKRTRQEDPVVHFYETFLAEYDPKMRASRGVYYTPEPVVSYIVRSVDSILKNKFGISKGLADAKKIQVPNPNGEGTLETHKVLILDPAVGTGTFMYGVIDHIYDSFKNQKGMWSSYVSQHLLPRLFGFELLMAPYTVAHMKLGLQLQELGYDFSSDERLRIYLTNTLQEAFQIPPADGFLNRIRDEAEAAKEVKQDIPVMVVLGNPPYSAVSMNTDPWIVGLIRDYYQVDGQPLKEHNSQNLLDDYVKFIRFAQHRVRLTGDGIVALITNHGYLDNPTFRGMRQNLMETFDEIYVLDLHGNSKKKEVCSDGSSDQNVFDIQQGVAIGIFVKYPESSQEPATVYHADLWGVRELYQNQSKAKKLIGGKYHWLAENDVSSTDWEILKPESSFYLFKPQDKRLLPEYQAYWKIADILSSNLTGVKTNRDKLLIDFDLESLNQRIETLQSDQYTDIQIKETYSLSDDRYWNTYRERNKIRATDWRKNIIPYLYRPFDQRYLLYQINLIQIGRGGAGYNIMQHMIYGDNLGLITSRQQSQQREWTLVGITKFVTDNCSISSNTKERSYLFPLYLYPTDNPTLFDLQPTNAPGGRRPNLSSEFIQDFSTRLELEFIADGKGDKHQTFGPEDIFNYIYAIFHSPTYRQRYAEFLKIDFPRVPLTSNSELFWCLCEKGDRLVNLHLMKVTATEMTSYPEDGDNKVEKVRYVEANQNQPGRVYINKTQYFEGVPLEVWNFYVGGYQVCQKWLKDRKDRLLDFDDLEHYQNIVAALNETMILMQQIDDIINQYGGFPIE